MAIDWYNEFVNLNYEPEKNELICLFYFEPAAGISGREAAGRIASESSTGTWTTLFTMPPRMKALQATAFDIEGNVVKIAYPLDLWEEGNAVQLLSGIAGNIFGMKAVKNLRLIDVSLPPAYIKHFKGPHFGNDRDPEDDGDQRAAVHRRGAQAQDRVLGTGTRKDRV